MKVRAKERGVYQTLREPGDVFEVADGAAASWFEPVAQPMEDPPAPPDDDPLGIQALDTPPEEPQPEPLEEAQPEEPQPETDNKPRKTNKPA